MFPYRWPRRARCCACQTVPCVIVRMMLRLCSKKQAWVGKEQPEQEAKPSKDAVDRMLAERRLAELPREIRLPDQHEEPQAQMPRSQAVERPQRHVLENRNRMSRRFGS